MTWCGCALSNFCPEQPELQKSTKYEAKLHFEMHIDVNQISQLNKYGQCTFILMAGKE